MKQTLTASARKVWHQGLRKTFSFLPRDLRFAFFRSFVDCDPAPDPRLVLHIAQTREDLEACFRLLHDAYVASGFMKPAPSGLRATIYHALPTTTTLCAKFEGRVVGTVSLIRESVFGYRRSSTCVKSANAAEESPRCRHSPSTRTFARQVVPSCFR